MIRPTKTLTYRIIREVERYEDVWHLSATNITRTLRAHPSSVSSILRKLVRRGELQRQQIYGSWKYYA